MSEAQSENQSSSPQPEQQDGDIKTPTKRTPSKRVSRAQRESEELIKNMGGSLDVEGGRKTRSSTRGSAPSTPATPPPAKKARTAGGTPRRGRPKKGDATLQETSENEEPETPTKKSESENADEKSEPENCSEDKATADKSATPNNEDNADKTEEETSEPDSKAKSSEDKPAESISEDAADEADAEGEASDSAPEKEEVSVPDSAAPAAAPTAAEENSTNADETAASSESPEPVEPMEVDGLASTAEEPEDPSSEEPILIAENNQTEESNDECVVLDSSPAEQKPAEKHENSIAGKPAADNASSVVISDEENVSNSNTDTNCSEPKLSTKTADVVAAQPCN